MVESRSKGKLRLDVRKFKFNWFSYDMELRDAVFFSADSNTASTSYRFSVKNIHIRVREIIPLVFEKKILIDSLRLADPDIRVTRLKATSTDSTDKSESVSLPQEMGRVYKSIQDALDVLKVSRFHIDNGKFSLINKVQSNAHPVTITNIDFHLDNLQVDTSVQAGMQKILFSDNVSLRTHNQDITFPDGRHRLQFKNFSINIRNRLVVFDSCTISATKADSSRSAFTIFFDKLLLTNIDFDTLYQKEIIRADSVYCINPRFKLEVELPERTGPRKPPPKLDELIQQLTGDLQLAFVVVQNGSFDINTVRNGRPSSFTSDNNNFELQGLRIRKEGPRPLTVKSFSMAIRNYENFLGDSSYAMQFDSIRLINNSILLNNFSLKQIRNGDTVNSFKMPQFELRGLSWDDLVFEQKLAADRATLYRPTISYTVPSKKNANRQDVFSTLAGLGDVIALNQLDISDGQINVFFNGGSSLQLQNAYVSLAPNQLADSKEFQSVQRSVRSLNFRTGTLKLDDLTAKLENVIFTGERGTLNAYSAKVFDKDKNIDVAANSVSMKSLIIDNEQSLTSIDGLQWKSADIKINNLPGSTGTDGKLMLTNFSGTNTRLSVNNKNLRLSTFQDMIYLTELRTSADSKIFTRGFHTTGRDLIFKNDSLQFSTSAYSLTDRAPSSFSSVRFKVMNGLDSISASVPQINFSIDLNSMLAGRIIGNSVTFTQPVIRISQQENTTGNTSFPFVQMQQVTIDRPRIDISFPHKALSQITWHPGAESKDYIRLTNLEMDSGRISARRAQMDLHKLHIQIANRQFGTGNGMIAADIESFLYEQQAGRSNWEGLMRNLQLTDIIVDSLGEKNGRIEIISARLNDIKVRDSSFSNLPRLVKENLGFRLADVTGNFENEDVRFDWSNVAFNKTTKIFSLDSFAFRPVAERDEFIARQTIQNDYMTFSTGAISAGPFDIDTYFSDTVIHTGNLKLANGKLYSFRDKRKPFEAGRIKPLPVNALRKIPVNITTDSIYISDAEVLYEELNEKTGMVGSVKLDRLNATVTRARNFDIGIDDSLHILAEARLLDSIKIRLDLRESYHDSLSGFLLRGNVGPTDVRVLNEVLAPLASIRLQSGVLDTMSFRVVGQEHLAFGEIDMYYRDLKVRFLKNGTSDKRGIFKGFVNFLANTFVIKNKNRNKTSLIFLERNREKSAINYVVKITLSGIGNSIGIRNNKKLLRQYKKELKKRNLPPVNFDMNLGD